MKQYLISLIFIISLTSFSSSSRKVTLFIAGDSTAQTYVEERDGLIKGWGQMLPDFFEKNVEVKNHAIGGRSTKTFLNEGRWDKLISEVRKGDYVFIQFGHNDASTRPERHASLPEYKANLTKMIQDVRNKKATPVLLTSVVMRTFVNKHLTDDRLKGYPVVTRILAKELNVPMIDVNQKTKDFVTILGDNASIPYYRWVEPGVDKAKPDGLKDDTHMMEKGAKQVTYFVAEGIKELKLKGLNENLKPLNPSFATASKLPAQKQVYLFSYFKGNGDGLHLAYSKDGLKWEALLNDSIILKPLIGKDRLMRDPSIVQDDNGVFHMVWTTGWWDQGIGYASSKDLINWSNQKNIPVMEKFEGTRNSWAPELFYDKKTKVFYIFWASTVPGMFPEIPTSESEKGLNHRQFFVTTKDFESFSETKVFFNPGFSVIDGAMLEKGGKYYLFVKNENSNPPEKNIRVIANSKPYGFPTNVSPPITGNYWAEGPTPLLVDEYVYVYFDKYRDKKYGAIRSKNMIDWEDVSESVSFPGGIRHGTAFTVSETVLRGIIRR
ncbi:MAG: family 43 glycosylhydrolase [Porphyromonadaceae bacterium]|nr:family 43 glycosylhydrolase [Porphyromonadaceae bacterium]